MKTKIKSFDKSTCRAVKMAVEKLLASMSKDYGIKVDIGAGRFSSTTFDLKITFTAHGADTREIADYKKLQDLLGMPDIGTIFTLKGVDYSIVGLKVSSPKNDTVIERVKDGKRFRYSSESIKKILG